MPAIVTTQHRILASDSFERAVKETPIYIFIGGTSPWLDENDPPLIKDSVEDIAFAYDELIGAKRVMPNNIISVIPRIDWVAGNIYDEYSDKVDLINDKNPITDDYYKFYVVTDEFAVYKCLFNNYNGVSTSKPSGSSVTPFQTPDGYIWKFMYNIRANDAFTYMTPNWIPCYTLKYNDGSSQWLVQNSAVSGTIDVIKMVDGGIGYNSATPPTVTITGDGTGATATAQVNDLTGTVESIIVTNSGQDYTEATVTITDANGVGATAIAVISPLDGHGKDARKELGAIYKMIKVDFQGTEGGILETDITYRKSGLVYLPRSVNVGTTLVVSDTKLFESDVTITGATSGATGDIVYVDHINGYIHVDNVSGVFIVGETVSSETYNGAELLQYFNDKLPLVQTVISADDIEPLSGEVLYFITREFVSRGLNQTEESRFIIQF